MPHLSLACVIHLSGIRLSLKIRKFNSRTLKMTEFAFIMYEALAPGSELI